MFLNKFSRHEMRAMQELEAADEVTETRIRSLRLVVITYPFGTERDNTFARFGRGIAACISIPKPKPKPEPEPEVL